LSLRPFDSALEINSGRWKKSEEVDMKVKKVLVVMVMGLVAAGFCNANVLTNGDCETGAVGDFPGWYFTVNAEIVDFDSSGYGTKCLQSVVGTGVSGQAIIGTAPATEGGPLLDASIDYKTLAGFVDGGGDWAFLRFWDDSAGFLSQVFIGPLAATNGEWVTHSITGIAAPAGADNADIFVAIGLFGSSSGVARFDNAIITPEPASMMLLGLGALALRRKK
jgi:PEP-CTERM motif-containing protein